MNRQFLAIASLAVAASICFEPVTFHAQIGYGVNSAGQLFRFNVNGIARHP